jgi:iron complex transport system permease protein
MPDQPRLPITRLALLAAGSLLVIAYAATLGPTALTWDDWLGKGDASLFWKLRLPRTLLAALCGAGLALGGVIYQSLFRNPLATPYTLGVAGGASLGAAVAFLLGLSGVWLGIPIFLLIALSGAFLTTLLVVLLVVWAQVRDLTRLLLAGVCVAYLCGAGVLLATYLADQAVTNEIVTWLMGSLARYQPEAMIPIGLALAITAVVMLAHHRALDLLLLGDDIAQTRGVNVARTMWLSLGLISLLTGLIVAYCGPIGFVGLMVPHFVRGLLGVRTGVLMVGSLLAGAGFLAICDGVARAVTLYELPVGIITNLLGGLFFLFLLIRGGGPHSGQK